MNAAGIFIQVKHISNVHLSPIHTTKV